MDNRRMLRVHIVGKEKGIVRPPELCNFVSATMDTAKLGEFVLGLDVTDGKVQSVFITENIHSFEVFEGTWDEHRERKYDRD